MTCVNPVGMGPEGTGRIFEMRRGNMAEHKSGPVELGAPMDYKEHEKTYDMFVKGAKYGTIHIAALLIAMAVGFFTSAGFIFSLLLFIILSALGIILL